MSVELVQFMSQLLNLVMFIKIFTHVKYAENKHSERMFLFLFIYSEGKKYTAQKNKGNT